jgi:hypothetical protein
MGDIVARLEKEICTAVEDGILSEPFNAVMMKEAVPGWDDRDYHLCLADHAVGNGHNSELFERVSFGLYCLTRSAPAEFGLRDETSVNIAERHSADLMKTFAFVNVIQKLNPKRR